jgi:tetraacyldisaccharide 4'-kinase
VGAAAEAAPVSSRQLHLLDDGFQHWSLARVVDVVLVTEEDLDDALLPAGNLREPLAALARADVVVLREDERERVEARVLSLLRADAAIWTLSRELRFPESLGGLEARIRPVAFCAIARPNGFYQMLREAGFDLAATVDFSDHHAYTLADMERITTMAKECGATGFVVTEKDAVKLANPVAGPVSDPDSGAAFHFAAGSFIERLQNVGPVCVAALEAKFVDETDVMRGLEVRLR